jgi:hypothetical protein
MDAELIDRIETNMERGASAAFAAALAYAAFALLRAFVAPPALIAGVAAAAVIAFLLCSGILKSLANGGQRFVLPSFEVAEINDFALDDLLLTDRVGDELVLTDADRVVAGELVLTDALRINANELLLTEADRLDGSGEPLVLDDILAEIGPDSRVVRLFDRAAMPTPGQLKCRIDDHLRDAAAPAPSSDAAQALSDALAELRRSLR